MKNAVITFIFCLFLLNTQSATYYSAGSVAPNTLSNWKPNRDGSGTSPSNFTSGDVFVIQNGHSMTTSATWSISGTGSKLWIEDGGSLSSNHDITLAGSTTFQIDNGGIYIQNVASSMGSRVFAGVEVFAANSNFTYNYAPTGTSAPTSPGYGNLTINTTSNSTNLGWAGTINSVQGNLSINSTGTGTIRHAFTANTPNLTVNIGGNFTISGTSNFWLTSGSATCTVNITGNLTISGTSTLDLANSSGAGTINLSGNFIVNGGTLKSNSAVSSINFGGVSKSFTHSSGSIASSNINWQISEGSSILFNNDLTIGQNRSLNVNGSIDCGVFKQISGSGTFTLNSSGTLISGNISGVEGSITVTGTKTFSTSANYTFNGTSAQVTGAYLPATVNNLTVDNAAGLTLSNNSLTVSGTLTINSGKKLEIGSNKKMTATIISNNGGNGGLVIKSDVTGTGSLINNTTGVPATVERYIAAISNWNDGEAGWHLVSSPVETEAISGDWTPSLTSPNRYDFYAWSESSTSQNWRNQKDLNNGITDFIPGQGYFVGYETAGTKTFTDHLNADFITFNPLSHTTGNAYAGWHLLGNPYPCALTWNAGSWTKENLGAYPLVWNSTAKSYKVLAGQGIIPAMSGFMVYAVTGGGNLTIPSDAKAHSDSVWYKSGEADMVTLSAIDLDRGGSQETMIHFTGTGNPGYNEVEDCLFLTGYAPRFYTRADNRSLALNTLPSLSSETEVTLWFEKNQSTRFSLHLDASGVDAQVLLTDIKTGQSVNLTHDPSYTFTSEPTDNPDRFRLHFSHVSTNDLNQEEGFRIFSGNQGIVILNSQERSFNGEVSVYNIVGQRIFGTTLQGNHIYRLPSDETGITQGYFIVKFVTGTNILTEKFYVDHFSN